MLNNLNFENPKVLTEGVVGECYVIKFAEPPLWVEWGLATINSKGLITCNYLPSKGSEGMHFKNFNIVQHSINELVKHYSSEDLVIYPLTEFNKNLYNQLQTSVYMDLLQTATKVS